MENNFIAVGPDSSFRFSCGRDVSCFNECCRDLNQFLTPYDLLRLKARLRISSGELLRRYTSIHTGPETGLPVARLRENTRERLKCPFVTVDGCAVYEDRPSSCRAYPVARAVFRDRETGLTTERFMLLKEPHCRGHESDRKQTVAQWIENQGLTVYNEMNDLLMEIISLKNRLMPGPLDIKSRHLFHIACYDLDAFRETVFEKGALEPDRFDKELLDRAASDDVALLKISLFWLKNSLFGEAAH